LIGDTKSEYPNRYHRPRADLHNKPSGVIRSGAKAKFGRCWLCRHAQKEHHDANETLSRFHSLRLDRCGAPAGCMSYNCRRWTGHFRNWARIDEQRAEEHAVTQVAPATHQQGEPRWPKVEVEEIAKPRNRRLRRNPPGPVQHSYVRSRRLHRRQQSKRPDNNMNKTSHRLGQTGHR
jgi:hypothetical protein